MKNKRGIGTVLFIFLGLMVMLAFAVGSSLLIAVANDFFDEFKPAVESVGVIEGNGLPGDNVSQNFGYVVNPANTITNSLSWIIGLAYILCLFAMIGLSVAFRTTGAKWTLALFFLLLLLAVLISMQVSNAYQDLYDGNDSLGEELRSMTLVSWLILYSPTVTLGIMLISALIMFTGVREEVIA